jgi:hypothetical protein
MNISLTGWCIIVASLIAIIILRRQSNWMKDEKKWANYKDLLNNIFPLVATFLGVFIAFSLTDLDSNREKTERTINILKLSHKSLENYLNYTNGLYSSGKTNSRDIVDWKINSRHPDFIATKATEIFYTISPYTYSDLISMESSINNGLRFIESSDSISNQRFRSIMAGINCYLHLAGKHILMEINYQEGNMTINQLHWEINQDHLHMNDSLKGSCFCTTFPITDTSSCPIVQTPEP